LELTGKIVWADLYGLDRDENAFGMGVCFVEIADKDRQVFEAGSLSFVIFRPRLTTARSMLPTAASSAHCRPARHIYD
jgi:hypothetical protein